MWLDGGPGLLSGVGGGYVVVVVGFCGYQGSRLRLGVVKGAG